MQSMLSGTARHLAIRPVTAAIFLAAFVTGIAHAAPGDLDTSFGSGGFAFTNLAEDAGSGAASAIARQADGRLVVAGYGRIPQLYDIRNFALVRYNADGSLDASFGNGGRVYTNFFGNNAFINDVAVQPDGRIVAAGYASQNGIAIVRYESDGSLDGSFADGGIFVAGASNPGAVAVAILADGKILAAGQSNTMIRLLRLNADGSTDETFGPGGFVELDLASPIEVTAMEVQPDDAIVLVGQLGSQCLIVRANADGSFDNSFDADGRATAAIGTLCESTSLALQSNGSIVVAGTTKPTSNSHEAMVLRYESDGSLDATFSGDGITTVVLGPAVATASSVSIQADGRIVVSARSGFPDVFAALRFEDDGSLDATFDGDGIVMTDATSAAEFPEAGLIQPDGRFVVAGTSYQGIDPNLVVLVRYESDGSLDSSFDSDGIVTTSLGGSADVVRSLLLRPDGRIVATGSLTRQGLGFFDPLDFGLAAYNPDGTPDTSFDVDGKTWLPVPDDQGYQRDAGPSALQPDGKVVVVGGPGNNTGPGTWVISRWNEDGSLDAGFGTSGTTIVPMSDYVSVPRAVALQGDGRIVVAGYAYVEFVPRFALVRLDSDGQLDASFDGDGIVFTDIGDTYAEARALLIQPDGRIVAAGTSVHRGFNAFAVARYLPDGSLDGSFSGDGKLITSILQTAYEQAESIAIQDDGKLVVAGFTEGSYEHYLAAVVRYNPNGLLDGTFDDDGKLTLALGTGWTAGRAVALQADGKVVLVASASDVFEAAIAIARLQPDGSPDGSFGTDGVTLSKADSHYDILPLALAIQDDGRILVGGTAVYGMGNDFALARFEGTDCGNNTIDGAEQCDDGNLVSEDGCSAGCRLEPCGAAPALGCKVPLSSGRARITIKDHPDDRRDVLTWRWSDGPLTDVLEFGDPVTSDDYWLCVYDAGQRVASTLVPSGGTCGNQPCWKEDSDKLSFRNGDGLPEGASQLVLLAGEDGQSSAAFRGRGVSLELPAAASIAGPLVVQLARGDGGLCLSSTFSAPFRKQDAVKLSARSD